MIRLKPWLQEPHQLYGRGEAVAVSYSSNAGGRMSYLGKDIMGSVRSSTSGAGILEDRYEYDAFGQPYKGDLSGGMNLGYTGKPYNSSTGLYDYGFRDYKPQAARFTTVDPIRDGNNWFAYVNNDPVNWIDPWGLSASDGKPDAPKTTTPLPTTDIEDNSNSLNENISDTINDYVGAKIIIIGLGSMTLSASFFAAGGIITGAGFFILGRAIVLI